MNLICRVARRIAVCLFPVFCFSSAQAALDNGDFETGSLSPWTTFTTANGTLGSGRPTISIFDVAGSGLGSLALGLSVGYLTAPCAFPGIHCPRPTEGGGIRQTAIFSGGLTTLHADLAVANSSLFGGLNADGGTFSILLDGLLLHSFSVGSITAGTVQRGQLDFTTLVSAGSHTLDVLVTRQASQSQSLTQYVDNVSVSAIPEPTTAALLGLGMLALVAFRTTTRAVNA